MSGATEAKSGRRFDVGLIVVSAACIVAWFIGGALTRPNLEWYDGLVKPGFVPSNGFFPIVWTVLYVMMAMSAWLVWRSPGLRLWRDDGAASVHRYHDCPIRQAEPPRFIVAASLCALGLFFRWHQFYYLGAEQRLRLFANPVTS